VAKLGGQAEGRGVALVCEGAAKHTGYDHARGVLDKSDAYAASGSGLVTAFADAISKSCGGVLAE
jgi:hypothetical protein